MIDRYGRSAERVLAAAAAPPLPATGAIRRRILEALEASATPCSVSDLALAMRYTSCQTVLRLRLDELAAAGLWSRGPSGGGMRTAAGPAA